MPVQDGPQFGVRFGYQLQFPSKNTVGVNEFAFFEAGHHLGYGGYLNLKAGDGVQFSPFFGLEHAFWPKSESYLQDCSIDSFPTFMSVRDSLPGRDFRFFNIVLEPAFKFFMRKMDLWFKVQPMLSYNIQRKVEQYNHSCGVPQAGQFVDYAPSAERAHSKFNLALGAGIVKEVRFKSGSGLALEPGVKLTLSRLLYVESTAPNGLDFTLYPWGFYLNLSFFR